METKLFTLGDDSHAYNPRSDEYKDFWRKLVSQLSVHQDLSKQAMFQLSPWAPHGTRVFSTWFWNCLQSGYLTESSTTAEAEAEKYTVLSADELLSCWSLCQDYLKNLHNDDELCLEHISEKFAEYVSLQRRLECRIELLQSREQS